MRFKERVFGELVEKDETLIGDCEGEGEAIGENVKMGL